MSVYKGVCAILDGEPDTQGEVLGSDFEIPTNPVRVIHESYHGTNIGTAYLEKEGNKVIAYVNFSDPEVHCKEVAEQSYAVISGSILEREANKIKKWILKEIIVTTCPADKNLTKLILNPRNGCCTYIGPPFIKCEKCGGRRSI